MAIIKQQVVTVAASRMSKQQRDKKKKTKALMSRPTSSLGMLYNVDNIEPVSVGSSSYVIVWYCTGIASY